MTTEQAAYGIAFLIIRELTELNVIERSRQGTGFDYWLPVRLFLESKQTEVL